MGAPFRFDRRFDLPVPPDDLWRVLTRTDQYVQWWSWLRRCEADGLRAGTSAACTVQAPLPYALRFTVQVQHVDAPRLLVASVTGDLEGPAQLEVHPAAGGASARLCWNLELRDPVLRRMAVVGRPAMVWAHDRVVGLGVEQFRRRALA